MNVTDGLLGALLFVVGYGVWKVDDYMRHISNELSAIKSLLESRR